MAANRQDSLMGTHHPGIYNIPSRKVHSASNQMFSLLRVKKVKNGSRVIPCCLGALVLLVFAVVSLTIVVAVELKELKQRRFQDESPHKTPNIN
jgi:hypothetical protein